MGMKAHPNIIDASKMEVGEIDTRAPFESVKAAVNLFGEKTAFSPYKEHAKKPKQQQSETTLAKERELHVAQKELNRLKDQLKNCETTRVQALEELEKAKQTVEELTSKLKAINESRELAVNATEVAKHQIKQLEDVRSSQHVDADGPSNHELEGARDQYAIAINDLNDAKQELHRIRQEFEASLDEKVSALEKETEAKMLTVSNNERTAELNEKIATMQQSAVHMNSASVQAKLEESKIVFEKDKIRQQHKLALLETEKKLAALKEEFDPKVEANLEAELIEKNAQIGAFQKEMQDAKTSDIDSLATVMTDLGGAKGVLQKFVEEEGSLRKLEESLKLELENTKKEHAALKERELETETIANDLNVKLQKSKAELEVAMAGEAKAGAACEDLLSNLRQLTLESENARKDTEQMKAHVEELRKEAEATKLALKEAESKLQVTLKDAEEAKAAEANAVNQIKLLSERTNAARSSTSSESGAKITISTEEFESLSHKVEESEKLAAMKVAAALAQVEAIKASESEAVRKLEASNKEMQETELATAEALKRAEMAEAARRAVEGELRKWREREQKKAAEAASRMFAEAEAGKEALPSSKTPPTKVSTSEKADSTRKGIDKNPAKKALMPVLSGIFIKKKGHTDSVSQSYLPGENPV